MSPFLVSEREVLAVSSLTSSLLHCTPTSGLVPTPSCVGTRAGVGTRLAHLLPVTELLSLLHAEASAEPAPGRGGL